MQKESLKKRKGLGFGGQKVSLQEVVDTVVDVRAAAVWPWKHSYHLPPTLLPAMNGLSKLDEHREHAR
eukprot:3564857-Prymnesium_polylepis.1